MGAWGLGLFQSDHDYDIIDDLNVEAGLDKLQDDAITKAKADAAKSGTSSEAKDKEIEKSIHYSIYSNLCSDPNAIRTHLETTGKLDELIAIWTAKANAGTEGEQHPGYKLVLLGACAMSLGCTLSEEFLQDLRDRFLSVGLMREALKQMDKALNGPEGFKNGEPYNCGSLGLHDTMDMGGAPEEDRLGPQSFNVPAPGGMFRGPDNSALINKIKARMEAKKEEKPAEVCGACGAGEGKDGKGLLNCAKCKNRKYCGKECQAGHWKMHKLICVKADAE